MNKKIVFMGTPDFAVPALEELYKSNFEIPLVITQQDKKRHRGEITPTEIKKKALELGLSVYQPADVNSMESVEKIKKIDPDYIVVIAYGQKIKEELLSFKKDRILNIHGSILPKYRGAAPIHRAIINGDKKTGVSIMLVDKQLDTGDVLAIKETDIDFEDTTEDVYHRLKEMGATLLKEVLLDFSSFYTNREKQNEEQSSYAAMLEKKEGKINFNQSAMEIYNKFRGLKPWPGSFIEYNHQKIKIHQLKPIDEKVKEKPGTVLRITDDGIIIVTGDGMIEVEEIQFPNKKRMSVSDYLKGHTMDWEFIES